MPQRSRRRFLAATARIGVAAALCPLDAVAGQASRPQPAVLSAPPEATHLADRDTERVSLDGVWQFRPDRSKVGDAEQWFRGKTDGTGWTDVTVPHTWQVDAASTEYYGTAWYRRTFVAPGPWSTGTVRLEFEAVFHSATVWVNGQPAGRHLGKGYTPFRLDISRLVAYGGTNTIVVRVDNAFDQDMLPRGRSSDWAHDGGIYRPVSLLVTPSAFVEGVAVEAAPASGGGHADIDVTVVVRNTASRACQAELRYEIADERTGEIVLRQRLAGPLRVGPVGSATVEMPRATLPHPVLWHFDRPHLYTLTVFLDRTSGAGHRAGTTFGVRSFEASDGGFYLNGERVFLMGVERMAGSHPDYGMAEPAGWIRHDHDDMKELNCVFTRVHWPQDRRVLDYCDRHGILMQLEVPTWGADTFKETGPEPLPALMQNGLEQLREMIAEHRNHPSVVIWGLCNEIGGQHPPAYEFARRMSEEARRLDPRRLRSYASNSLQRTPERDVSALMDVVEWNEYYETWYGGTVADVGRNLDELHRAFPGKAIVISEYGYCACTPDRPEGDQRRIEILTSHTAAARARRFVGGLIFFCYNDYRTHIGDTGRGALKQRVHGVVDVYGARKPSFDVLRRESSPVERLGLDGLPPTLTASIRARADIPAYPLVGYTVRWIVYNSSGIPVEQREEPLARLEPGGEATVRLEVTGTAASRVRVDVLRPTRFSVATAVWKAKGA